MTTFCTSDLHFGHSSILQYYKESKYALRSVYGNDVESMDSGLIERWNNRIAKTDKVYILGDVSFHKMPRTLEILDSLNGKKILIAGNHDFQHIKNEKYRERFEAIHHYLEIKVKGIKVVMCHFPISDWNQKRYGSIMLHGHLHGGDNGLANKQSRIFDVGIDATNKIAVELDSTIFNITENFGFSEDRY